ncbi:uncharacterized protein LOC133193741 [Saccostrea echinata]|uniref:uncharacterized protein LOC133193741 n=1 Tax=Saccostrea echinata TaxID=191078 RepID=UPI002A806A75|nr:uncharacterized protein LOC133193741 [Saccostrea echinata]
MVPKWPSKSPFMLVDSLYRFRGLEMDLKGKVSVAGIWIFLLYATTVCVTRAFRFPKTSSPIKRNCSSLSPCKRVFQLTFAEKVRIDMLKKHIMNELNIQDNTVKGSNNGILRKQQDQSVPPKPEPESFLQEMAEIVSFSEKPENISERNVLSFTIDVSTKPKQIEAVSAHLWILMRKRKRGRSKGRKVILRVMKVPNQKDEKFHYLTALRTRVKKSRWQKISLPVTLIQSMLDSKDKALNLRISCKYCGRMVRPVLFRREDKNLTMKNGKTRRGKKRRRRRRRMRNRKTNENNRIQPFLVISTRYRHTFKKS